MEEIDEMSEILAPQMSDANEAVLQDSAAKAMELPEESQVQAEESKTSPSRTIESKSLEAVPESVVKTTEREGNCYW